MESDREPTWGGRQHWALVVILAIFVVYAGLFIFKSSFVIEGERYFSLCDDAMISMRYARNLATGHGLVWNPGGERVEGFTTPLWTLHMALVHFLPIPASKISLLVQMTGALCLFLNLLIVARIAGHISSGDHRVVLGSVLVTGFFYPLNNWALQGMEVGLLALIVSVATLASLRSLEAGKTSGWLYVLLAGVTLVRLDAGVISIATLIFLYVFQPSERRRHITIGFGLLFAALLGQTLCRWSYYGDLLPNTYYLKITGFPLIQRIEYGFRVLWARILQLGWFLCLFPFLSVLFGRRKEVSFLIWLILCQAAYSVYVGGDAWEWIGANRYLAVVLPLFFVLFSFSVVRILDYAALRLGRPGPAAWAVTTLLVLAAVRFNFVGDRYSLLPVILKTAPPSVRHNEQMVRRARLLSRVTSREATLAVVWAGAIPYFCDRTYVDLLGKNDRKIARQPMKPVGFFPFYPGHMKRDYGYSIGQLKPDVVVQLWVYPQEAKSSLEGNYVRARVSDYCFLMRKTSARVLWDRMTVPGDCTEGPAVPF